MLGVLTNLPPLPTPNAISSEQQYLDFRERDVSAHLDQLICDHLSIGVGYQLTAAHVSYENQLLNVPATEANARYKNSQNAKLNQVSLFANYFLPCGFFTSIQLESWIQNDLNFYQEVSGVRSYTGGEPGANFWQLNLFAGYRFPRRHMEIQVRLLNATAQDYQLDPLTYYIDPAHTRTFEASFKFNF